MNPEIFPFPAPLLRRGFVIAILLLLFYCLVKLRYSSASARSGRYVLFSRAVATIGHAFIFVTGYYAGYLLLLRDIVERFAMRTQLEGVIYTLTPHCIAYATSLPTCMLRLLLLRAGSCLPNTDVHKELC